MKPLYAFLALILITISACSSGRLTPSQMVERRYSFEYEVVGKRLGVASAFGDKEHTFLHFGNDLEKLHVVARDAKTKKRLGMKQEGRVLKILSSAPVILLEVDGKKGEVKKIPTGAGKELLPAL